MQTVRDWVLRFNAEGPEGLLTGKAPGARPLLNPDQRQALERVAGLTAEQAKSELVAAVEHDAKRQAVIVARDTHFYEFMPQVWHVPLRDDVVPDLQVDAPRAGYVVPAAWAIPAVPRPASLEKMPRATPKRIAAITAAPAKPPVAAIGLKAWVKIRSKAAGIAEKLTATTTIAATI